jgi:hypothetical protein
MAKDHVFSSTLKKAYQEYCEITNSYRLGSRTFQSIIEQKFDRHYKESIRIEGNVRGGFECLKFDQEYFDGLVEILRDARKLGLPVFKTLLDACPNFAEDYTTRETIKSLHPYTIPTLENTISILLCWDVGSVGVNNVLDSVDRIYEKEFEKNKNLHKTRKKAKDTEKGRREISDFEKKPLTIANADPYISEAVKEYVATGGKAGHDKLEKWFKGVNK